jgi:enamine deaminase RidA (YjgF/YER057c/UK114 family)
MSRRSIEVEGFHHGGAPIPAACRVGPLVMTGGVYGLDPESGEVPDDANEQARLMFSNLSRILKAAGGSLDDLVKITVWAKAPEARAALNVQWLALFPDSDARPARHTFADDELPANIHLKCEATAYVAGREA